MHPSEQWRPPATQPPQPPSSRGNYLAAALILLVLVVAVAVIAILLMAEPDSPEVATPQTPFAQLDDDSKALATCQAAQAAIKKDPDGLDLQLKKRVIQLGGSSGVTALQDIAAANPGTDLLDARAGFRAIAGWCDDHDVAWPN